MVGPEKPRRLRGAVSLALAALACTTLAACGGSSSSAGGGSANGDTLVIADQATPVAVDPTAYSGEPMLESIYNTYATLLRFKATEVAPGVMGDDIHASAEEGLEGWLAKSWRRTSPTTLRFELRRGVESAAGNELTSADVVYTVKRHLALRLVGSQTLGQGRIVSAKPIGRYAVELRTSVPSSVAPFIATQPQGLGILDATEVKQHATGSDPWAEDWLKLHTAGFGPYQLSETVPGQRFTFTANPNYFDGAPALRTVEWRQVSSASDRVALLRAGEVDVAETIPPQLRKDLRDSGNVRVVDVGEEWSVLTVGLTPNFKRPPLDERAVRQAIAYLLPNQQIIDNVLQREGSIRRSWIAASLLPGRAGEFWTYEENVEKAKQLLAEAGLPEGFETSISFDSSQATHEQIASLLKAALARGGIDVSLNKLSATKYSDTLAKRNFDILMTYGGPLTPNAAYELDLWYDHDNFIDSGSYHNPEVEKLIGRAITADDREQYLQTLSAADRILAQDVPRIGIVNTGDHYQFSADLRGFYWRANTNHYDWARFSR